MKNILSILFLVLGHYLSAQRQGFSIPDSLRNQSYDTLFQRIEDNQQDASLQSIYIRSFLEKAYLEKNWEEVVNGYKNYIHYSELGKKLVYADSMVYAAKISANPDLVCAAYLSKGIVYYGQKRHDKALDNYLIANEYVGKVKDIYLSYKVKYHIALVKYYLGSYREAIELFSQCLTYFRKEDSRAYLNCIHSLGLCYNKSGNYGLCTQMNLKGIDEGKTLKNKEMESYFIHSEGINQYCLNNFSISIEKIQASLAGIIRNRDFANLTVGHFYIGKSYWALKKPEIAMSYFRKVDKSFKDSNYIRPDLLENYTLMIAYYKNKNDLKGEYYYMGRLLKAKDVVDSTYKYLTGKIDKVYDVRELKRDKKNIEIRLNRIEQHDRFKTWVNIILAFALVFMIWRYFWNRKKYRKNYEQLMLKSEEKKVAQEAKKLKAGGLEINKEAVAIVLKLLEKFERDKKFLEKDWTLVKLSAAFNSNTKYLSQIIFHYRGKKFTKYINDLKIEHLVELLKKDRMLRNYTNKALGELVGFTTTQRFTNAFFSRTGIFPNYFIEELKKEAAINLDNTNCSTDA